MLAEKYRCEAVDCYVQNALVCHSDDEKCIGWAVKERYGIGSFNQDTTM